MLCTTIAEILRRRLIPDDHEQLGRLVENICYKNAEHYFGLVTAEN